MIKFPLGIVSDVHWGIKSDDEKYLELHTKLFKWISEQFLSRGVKTVLFLGDMYHNRNELNVMTMQTSIEAINDMSKLFDLVILKGNHDCYFKNSLKYSSLSCLHNINVVEKFTEIDSNNKKILISPWIIKEDDFWEWTENKKYDLIFGHFDIVGGHMTSSEKSRNGLNAEKLSSKLKNGGLVISGHYHVKRWLSNNILYAGAAMPLTWADVGEEKSIYVIDENGILESIDNNISPKYMTINVNSLNNDYNFSVFKNNNVKMFVDINTKEKDSQKFMDLIRAEQPFNLTTMDTIPKVNAVISEESVKLKDPIVLIKEYISTIDVPDTLSKDKFFDMINHYYREASIQ